MCLRRISLSVLLAAVAAPAYALSSDRNQPAELQAKHAQMNNTTGVGVYTGNVVLTQGSMRITADKMTVHTSPGGRLSKVIAEGREATFRQLPDGQDEPVTARAPYMEYRATEPATVDLRGGAVLSQGKNEFRGEVIHYDVSKELVTAKGGAGDDERIRITFFPEEKKETAPSQDSPSR